MTDVKPELIYYWERYKPGKLPPGEDLAAMRQGVGREPMEIPKMWPFYVRVTADGMMTASLRAEHAALGLFGVHQQSQRTLMHWPGVPWGDALQALRSSGRYSEAALDRRVAQAVTATDLIEVTQHLRGLVSMLKTLPNPQGLDYSLLVDDLTSWQYPRGAARVRRHLGLRFFRPSTNSKETSA